MVFFKYIRYIYKYFKKLKKFFKYKNKSQNVLH